MMRQIVLVGARSLTFFFYAVEHKGINNRVLRELGWVVVFSGNRDTPRNSEIRLQSLPELMAKRRELLQLQGDAVRFIGAVFSSHDRVWVERCSSIVVEE